MIEFAPFGLFTFVRALGVAGSLYEKVFALKNFIFYHDLSMTSGYHKIPQDVGFGAYNGSVFNEKLF